MLCGLALKRHWLDDGQIICSKPLTCRHLLLDVCAPQAVIDVVRPGIEASLAGRATCTTALSGMLEVRGAPAQPFNLRQQFAQSFFREDRLHSHYSVSLEATCRLMWLAEHEQ
jgi:hypothetical protein